MGCTSTAEATRPHKFWAMSAACRCVRMFRLRNPFTKIGITMAKAAESTCWA